MLNFSDWCTTGESNVGPHTLRILTVDPAKLNTGISAIAAIISTHYVAEERIAQILARLGKPAAAKFIQTKLPTLKSIKSGDLGEIMATEYIASHTGYEVPIKRLRWKDHRNASMRGDDVIGVALSHESGQLQFLKTEAKSRDKLNGKVVSQARLALDKDEGLPSPHALTFISSRLNELGNNSLANAIDDALLKSGIPDKSVKHLIFTISGNSPVAHLNAVLRGYDGTILQTFVGVWIDGHAAFVNSTYALANDYGNNN